VEDLESKGAGQTPPRAAANAVEKAAAPAEEAVSNATTLQNVTVLEAHAASMSKEALSKWAEGAPTLPSALPSANGGAVGHTLLVGQHPLNVTQNFRIMFLLSYWKMPTHHLQH
jgi:hypothetical protein